MDTTRRILIVDDEIDLAQMIAFQFSSKGFETQTAMDGVEALGKLKNFTPDLIILDVNMPRMGGIEFYSKICGSNSQPLYPVLVLTARANIKDLFKQFDIDGFMIKPFEIDQLVAEAETIIKRHSRDAKKISEKTVKGPRKICIVENEAKAFSGITAAFIGADYIVNPAHSGMDAIDRMMGDIPDVALVQLGLDDIPGDVLVFRLSQMSKTMGVKFILYTKLNNQHETPVMKGLKYKTGVFDLVEYDKPQDLLEAVDRILQK